MKLSEVIENVENKIENGVECVKDYSTAVGVGLKNGLKLDKWNVKDSIISGATFGIYNPYTKLHAGFAIEGYNKEANKHTRRAYKKSLEEMEAKSFGW